MTTVNWSAVPSVSATWNWQVGYMFTTYVADDYVIGDEESPFPSGTWTVAASAATAWA